MAAFARCRGAQRSHDNALYKVRRGLRPVMMRVAGRRQVEQAEVRIRLLRACGLMLLYPVDFCSVC